ncbi:hypothetical protein EVAR_47809_1 [Eumeta japonica]|uniref:Uncharacterized protein n=1 Tax=Eumeta variegata TaxID=151549 RepID=A0A4C1ZAP6_EUMVA|nr:hypothetical protein EVAR_47809_1 [Eumeta japonica]
MTTNHRAEDVYSVYENQEYSSTVMWWYQWRKINGFFRSTMNTVSPSSGIFESTNICRPQQRRGDTQHTIAKNTIRGNEEARVRFAARPAATFSRLSRLRQRRHEKRKTANRSYTSSAVLEIAHAPAQTTERTAPNSAKA